MAVISVAIRCQISRGGFSGERIVTTTCSDRTERKGLAPTGYCWDSEQRPLGPDDPSNGESIEGLVAARICGPTGPEGHVNIKIPDGEVMTVPRDSVVKRPSQEAVPNVFV